MNIHDFYRFVFPMFRRVRMERFAEALHLTKETTVLDVGGDPAIWEFCPIRPIITFLNRYHLPTVPLDQQIIADGCHIPMPDKSFDVAFSNSVIEHVGNDTRQLAFANELMRIGKHVWCQTPDRLFPVEPHLLSPFVHWLPREIFENVAPLFSLRALMDSHEKPVDIVRNLKLLTHKEMRFFFPHAEIRRESLFGWPKSLIAIL